MRVDISFHELIQVYDSACGHVINELQDSKYTEIIPDPASSIETSRDHYSPQIGE